MLPDILNKAIVPFFLTRAGAQRLPSASWISAAEGADWHEGGTDWSARHTHRIIAP